MVVWGLEGIVTFNLKHFFQPNYYKFPTLFSKLAKRENIYLQLQSILKGNKAGSRWQRNNDKIPSLKCINI